MAHIKNETGKEDGSIIAPARVRLGRRRARDTCFRRRGSRERERDHTCCAASFFPSAIVFLAVLPKARKMETKNKQLREMTREERDKNEGERDARRERSSSAAALSHPPASERGWHIISLNYVGRYSILSLASLSLHFALCQGFFPLVELFRDGGGRKEMEMGGR